MPSLAIKAAPATGHYALLDLRGSPSSENFDKPANVKLPICRTYLSDNPHQKISCVLQKTICAPRSKKASLKCAFCKLILRRYHAMQTMLILEPPWRVDTPDGKGYAYIYRDSGAEGDVLLTVILDDRRIMVYRNIDVRAADNWTMGRRPPERKAK